MPARSVYLITGASGLLGPYLLEEFSSRGSTVGAARANAGERCDLEDAGDTARLIERVKPDVILHAAAMTDVDECEREPDRAFAANETAVRNIVGSAPPKTRVVLISTDQVYPDTSGPHAEENIGPVNVYGRSKFAGERAVREHPRSLVVRTNFFGPSHTTGRSSFSDWLIDSFRRNLPMTLFEDVLFSPLHIATLAGLIALAVDRGLSGVFNFGGRNGVSKKDFGLLVAEKMCFSAAAVKFGTSSSIPGRAPRPLDLRMDVTRLERSLELTLPTVRQEVAKL